MAAIPLHSNFEGDFVPVLVEVDSDDTMDVVAEKCAHHSVGLRVAPQPGKILRVRQHGASDCFPREMTVAGAGLKPTEVIDVIFADE